MEWQKKRSNKTFAGGFGCMLRKKRPFPGKRKVNNTSETVMYRLHIYYITAS